MPVSAAKCKVPVSVHISPIAQLAPKDGLQSGFQIDSKITVPAMRARIAGSGIHEPEPDDFSLLDVDAEFGPELAAGTLTRCWNTR